MADPPPPPEPRPDVPLPPGFAPPGPAPAGAEDELGPEHEHEHEHPDHDDSHEPLPRRLLAGLVAEAEESRERRGALVVALLSIGLALLALGLPSAVLVQPGPAWITRMAAGEGPWPHAIPGLLVLGLSDSTGLALERTAFLVSALALGLVPGAAFVAAGRVGLRGGARVAASLLVATAPSAWLAATQPGPAACGLLGATILLGVLVDPRRRSEAEWMLRALAGCLLAVALGGTNAWLMPLFFVAALPPAGPWAPFRARRSALWAPALACVLLGALLIGVADLQPNDMDRTTLLMADGHFDAGPPGVEPAPAARFITLLLGGGALPGLLIFLARHRPPEGESPAPRWWRAWLLLALMSELAHLGELPWLTLLPLGLLGAAAWWSGAEERWVARYLVLLVVLQAVACGVVDLVRRESDPDTAWRERAVEALQPADVLLTGEFRHLYLLRHRYGLEAYGLGAASWGRTGPERVEELVEELAAAAALHRRIVLDSKHLEPPARAQASDLAERFDLTDL